MRRWRGQPRLAFPSEKDLLRQLGARSLEAALATEARDDRRLFVIDIPRAETASLFADQFPQQRARIIETAGRICAHRFDLLGSGPKDLGPRLPWHVDFKTGHTWDRDLHHEELRKVLAAETGRGWDVKIPWELSRCQHFPTLGQAFWMTSDRRFYGEFRAQVVDWIQENRPGFGINWVSPMDVTIRAVNWIWAYGFFRPEILADRPFASLLLRSLLAHGRFLAAIPVCDRSRHGVQHLAGHVGLLFLGVLFRGSPEADAWKGRAMAEILGADGKLIAADGVVSDGSIAVHRLATEMALTALLLMERSGFQVPQFRARVREMVDFVAHYTKPSGLAPQIGDNDGGRLQILGDYDADRRDHRHLLAVAGCAFGDRALVALAQDRWEEAYWFFGPRGSRTVHESAGMPGVEVISRVYPLSGIAVLRHGDRYVILDAGAVGQGGSGSHAHNDTLSFEMHAGGQDLIVDPGMGTHTPDLALRQRFRSTSSHNTVRVDGREINPLPDHPFELRGVDRPALLRFISRKGFDMVEAEHRGYLRLTDPVVHRRLLLSNKRSSRLVVEDRIEGRGRHQLEWFFHLAPGSEARIEPESRSVRARAGDVRLLIEPEVLPAGAQVFLQKGQHSRSYGQVEPSRVVRYVWEGDLPALSRFGFAVGASGGDRIE